MADPFYSLTMSSASNAHKRSYDDIAPELDAGSSAPGGSRSEPVDSSDSSSSTSRERERNKRPRNENSDSSYTSEVEDILLPSNTSVSSSSSGSSHSSYHSARSTFTAASPPLLEVEEELEDDLLDPATHSSEPFADVSLLPTLDASMEDTLSFVSRPVQTTSPPPARPSQVPDSEEQFRRTMERVDAFDREMSALRRSPFRTVDTTDWASWDNLYHGLVHADGSASRTRMPDPLPTVSEEPPATGAHAAHRTLNVTDRLQPTSSSMFPDDPFSYVPRVNLPRAPADPLRSRFSQLERDAARYGDTVGRGRAREDIYERLLGERPTRSPPFDFFSIDSVRRGSPHRTFEPLPPPRPNPPTSSSRLFPDLHTFVDDFWQRENDRQLEGFDRTIREAEEHRQRTAEFLAQAEGPLRSSLSSRVVRDPTTASVSSGYSTLRGALDDSAARRRSLGSRAPSSSSYARPATDRFNYRRSLFDEPVESIGQNSGLDLSVRDLHEPSSLPRDMGLSSVRPSAPREPQPQSTAYSFSSVSYPTDIPTYAPASSQPHRESYLEMNSRARSSSISGLRRRARARSRSSPSPPLPPIDLSALWNDTDSLSRPSWSGSSGTAGSSMNFESSRRPRHRVSRGSTSLFESVPPPRDPSPDLLDLLASEPPIWGSTAGASMTFESTRRPRRVPPEPSYPIHPPTGLFDSFAPSPRQPTTSANRTRPTRTINLDEFREGPFRATLARSMAYSRETRQPSLVSAERERPASTQNAGSAFSDSSEEDDVPSRYLSRLRQEPRSVRRDLTTTTATSQLRTAVSRDRSFAFNTRWLDEADDAYRTFRARASNPGSSSLTSAASTAQPTVIPPTAERASASAPSERDFDMQRPVDRLRDLMSRPSATPATGARRTLLGRERSLSHLQELLDDDDPPARSTGLERWEQRRQVLQRFSSRVRARDSMAAASGASSAHPTPTAAPAPRETPRSSDTATPSFLDRPVEPPSRRYPRVTQLPPRYGAPGGRAEGPSPLNGRFARRSYAPDMVWVDLPSIHRPPHSRRRWIGDYMRDEDIDMSYEGLLSLSSLLGDVKPRGTPEDVISSLPKGTYGEWVRPGVTEERCPICLDDYAAADACMRIPGCSHWFHDGCLQQWLKTARTCPVCRGRVHRPQGAEATTAPVAGASGSSSNDRRNNTNTNTNNRDEEDEDSDRDGERTPRHWSPYLPPWRHD